MKKMLIFCLILCVQLRAQEESPVGTIPATNAGEIKLQKTMTRVKPSTTDVPNDSSSFIGDADNIDPLNPNRESLKDDEEPVLEEIKRMPDASPAKKQETELEQKRKALESKKKMLPKKKSTGVNRRPDDPDTKLEKKFHSIYRIYNINPTPLDEWAAATAEQTVREYVVQHGDNLWTISEILFGDPTFWPKIWSLNKLGILNPHFIKPDSKIYFYMGSEESAPTLSLNGKPTESGALEDEAPTDVASNQESAQQSPDAEINTSANTKTKATRPGLIPDSFPLHRNKKYFEDDVAAEIKVDLGTQPIYDYENTSEIYIVDQPIKTEVQIQIAETAKFRCYEGRIARDIRYVGKLVEDYDVFEPLSSFQTTIGTMYAYRVYGSARPYQNKFLKIFNCKSIIATDLVILPKEKIQTLRNQKFSVANRATLIGGPDVVAQRLFVPNQLAYVDFGGHQFSPGQQYKVMSQVTDEVNGNIKIIEKYGSFAVVMITEVNDVIEIGDKVILN